jgi:hypothetical protein
MSTVFGASNKQAGISEFWDEEGVYHCHNPNKYFQDALCSNGHSIMITTINPCPAPECSIKGSVVVSEPKKATGEKDSKVLLAWPFTGPTSHHV